MDGHDILSACLKHGAWHSYMYLRPIAFIKLKKAAHSKLRAFVV